jgi:SAM-dependent methyltransferase
MNCEMCQREYDCDNRYFPSKRFCTPECAGKWWDTRRVTIVRKPDAGETAKAHNRRVAEGFFEKYIHGRGIDIGCGSSPVHPSAEMYDRVNGHPDAEGIPDLLWTDIGAYDYVYSSHCLEHLPNPKRALTNWWSLVKPGGHLIVAVPHRDLYERCAKLGHGHPWDGKLPSLGNGEHCTFWVADRHEPTALGLRQFVEETLSNFELKHIRVCDAFYGHVNQHVEEFGEYQIEIVLQKGNS